MKMIPKSLFSLMCVTVLLFSCDDAIDSEFQSSYEEAETAKVALIDSLTIGRDTIIPIAVNPDSIKSKFIKQNLLRSLENENYDENLLMNMLAIRELPITIQARGSGNTGNEFLSTNGKGKEITLSATGSSGNQRFYLRIPPGSTGIPYLIYSDMEGTPISGGEYERNPDNKVLYTLPDESGSLFSASWDLIPSSDYRGYFAIQNQAYLGQSDPNNMWSVFNYVLEAKDNDKIGYAQYTQKAQQEFLISPVNGFTLDYIEFYKDEMTVTKRPPLKVVTSSKNDTEERRPFTIKAAHYADDEYYFSERSALKIPVANLSSLFYRPIVEAERLVLPSPVKPEDDPDPIRDSPDMQYADVRQKIQTTLNFEINGTAAPNSLIEATSYLENYTVSAKYTAYMTYDHNGDIRKVQIDGVWNGVIHTTTRDDQYPKDIIKFYDLDDGGEILRMKSVELSPIIFK